MEQHEAARYELQIMLEPGANAGTSTGGAAAGSGEAASIKTTEAVKDALRALYGNDGVYDVKVMSNILPGPAGKFRRTQANFDYDWKGLFV
jgi:hypothetical protein